MLSREAAGIHPKSIKNTFSRCLVLAGANRKVNPIVQYSLILVLSSCHFAHTPSVLIQRAGRVGLFSDPHGKPVAYKNYIEVIKIFNSIAL